MNLMKRVFVLGLAGAMALSLQAAAFAQGGQGRGRRGGTTIPQTWIAKLNLNADQQAKLKTANDTYAAEQQKLQALTPEERRTASRTIRETYQSAVNGILTADQQKQLTAMREEARQYRGLGPVGNQLVGLNLTAEQKTKIQAIGTKYEPEMMKLREMSRGATDRQAARQAQRELQMKMVDEVRAVLTPEQQKQLQPVGRRRQNQ